MNRVVAAKVTRRSFEVCRWFLLVALAAGTAAHAATAKQKSLDQWRKLTSATATSPQVFVKGDRVRFYFSTGTNLTEFSADWSNLRVPTDGYRVSSALLRHVRGLARLPESSRGWRKATVIAGADWRRLSTNLLEELTPETPGHGVYYQAFLSDRVLYRDAQGIPRFALQGHEPAGITIDHQFPIEETLEILARRIEEHLIRTHPGESLFLIMAPNANRFTLPLLLDRERRQCVWLSPSALYDPTERGFRFATSARGVGAFLFESHGLALLKNPISSAFRLADLGLQIGVQFLRLPLPMSTGSLPPATRTNGMDLGTWEKWLDRYTGTRLQDGSLKLLIDGDRFYTRLRQAIAEATNHIDVNVYIFDRDDVAVSIADLLKQRSAQVKVHVIMDQMGSLAAGLAPPATPMPEDFTSPASIAQYLKKDSKVRVRPFLNPWFSTDHQKIYLVDGKDAWLGGMNLGREYRYEWHDLMLEVHGPVVTLIEKEFRHAWAHAGPFGDLAYFVSLFKPGPKPPPCPEPTHWIKVRLLPTRTAWKPFNNAVRGALHHAQSYIYVENPYLFNKRVIADLVYARRRGVDVRVVLPRVNDFKAGGRSNLVTANYLRAHGVRVYFYPGMTHVKALLADGWACLGSGNLNNLSLHICQEQNIATSDPAFAAKLKHDLFEEDFRRSYELHEAISVDWVDFLADTLLQSF